MTWLKLLLLRCAPLLLAFGAACSSTGGQTGEETQEPCVETKIEVRADEVTQLGFSGNQVLSALAEPSSAALSWLPVSDVSYGPEAGTSSLTLVVRGHDAMYYVESEPRSTGAMELLPVCRDRLEIELAVSISTTGGAVAEAFETTLRAATIEELWLTHDFQPTTLTGSFSVEPQSLGASRFTQFTLEAHWSAGTFGGIFSVGLEQVSGNAADGSASYRRVPVACFSNGTDPTMNCGPLP